MALNNLTVCTVLGDSKAQVMYNARYGKWPMSPIARAIGNPQPGLADLHIDSVLRSEPSNDSPAPLSHHAEPAELLSDINHLHRNQRQNHDGTERKLVSSPI
jgi:hypothetical protein